MKKLRGASLTFLTIGGIFSVLLFELLIMLKNKIVSEMLLYNAAQMLLEDIARLVLQISNQEIYRNMLNRPDLVDGILIGISSFLVLMYLIPNYLSKNNGYKGFGASLAFISGTISCILLSMAVFLVTKPQSLAPGLNIFKLGFKIGPTFVLLFIGPVLTFLGGILAIVYYSKAQKTEPLTVDQQNRLTAINLETGKIGACGLTPQKEMVSQVELTPSATTSSSINKPSSSTNDLKAKMAVLKTKMARNALFHEEGEAHLIPEEDNNSKLFGAKPTIRVGEEGQYLRTIKDGEGIVDESPEGLLIEQEGNFVQKGDIIKHRDYSAPIFREENTTSKGHSTTHSSIIIPKSKQHMPLDTTELAERIGSVPKPSGQQQSNPNARFDSSYDGKVFLGDIDKIWTAGKKYREDITKNQHLNNSSQTATGHDNLDDYSNENDDKTDENHYN